MPFLVISCEISRKCPISPTYIHIVINSSVVPYFLVMYDRCPHYHYDRVPLCELHESSTEFALIYSSKWNNTRLWEQLFLYSHWRYNSKLPPLLIISVSPAIGPVNAIVLLPAWTSSKLVEITVISNKFKTSRNQQQATSSKLVEITVIMAKLFHSQWTVHTNILVINSSLGKCDIVQPFILL